MPSETAKPPITGRCYCGLAQIAGRTEPQIVTYCHCQDCRRVTASPLPTFAAFGSDDIDITGVTDMPVSHNPGVKRWFCRACGSQLAAVFDYLPDQIYVPLGELDQADALAPSLHCHADAQLSWLHLDDGLPRESASGRAALRDAPDG